MVGTNAKMTLHVSLVRKYVIVREELQLHHDKKIIENLIWRKEGE
jgi:hypothetical protein